AMVFQNYALYPHMTVFENMSFGLRLRRFPKDQIRERVEHAARILDITELLDRRPKQLSGGQRQRVVTGRAIVRNPKAFLFGAPQELYHHPKTRFVAGFIGSPAMNFVPSRLEANGSGLSLRVSDKLTLPVPAARAERYRPHVGKDLTFGLRPEHITEPRGEGR